MTRNTTRTIRAIILATLMITSVVAMNVSLVGTVLADQGTAVGNAEELTGFDATANGEPVSA
ncbi:hypothetical protein HUG10_14330 [Halorarum halophilum]|uniref:Uncharacterized protein n=1 Tax=Halorarum halophilum TaxID=2743090 RepID=A0A7D5GYJ6_9EURY|nr:surface glycoprotein [Halobaculum halophilum]QLG28649.1 hypothetical protein HUG10_14330 [Halobaculum halophilum]